MTDPTTDPVQVITHGNVRVSVLTDRLVRIEYATDAVFEDRPSLSVVNRRFPQVRFRARTDGNTLVVDTGTIELHYEDVTKPPTAKRLHATIRAGDDVATWHHGKRATKNLGGTARTLDGWDGDATARFVDFDPESGVVNAWDPQPLEPGLLSRDGWVLVDDSATVLVSSGRGRTAASRPTAHPRPEGRRFDAYLFGYHTDHAAALRDAAALLGPQPLPPRYAFGYWYSRYYPYTDRELVELTESFDRYDVPLDVVVIDMDWHRPGWTGYSWDRDLFVDPTATLADVHDRRLRVSLNLHPADGVAPHEDAYPAMCAALGLDPADGETIRFAITDPAFVDAYFRLLHHPEEDRGVDVWWLDWQQGTDTPIAGLDPLAWLNLLHTDDQTRRRPKRRPLILSRWGGLGAGRYPLGFSGDTYATWKSLAFQPSFTATAANVGYGYWSHDIGGHFQSAPDAELYTRWIQFGVYSPVLRTHGSLDASMERRVWEYPNPYRDVMIAAIRRRYALIPYVYGEARRCFDTGLCLVRPMYHEHPEVAAAYDAPGQYLFGSQMVVAPVTAPREDDTMAPVRVWLPKGDWFDVAHGARLSIADADGTWFTRRYLLDEVPTFVP
ncbi:MAG TPA: TIM-barrel domain-containing protein, partial [Acidimicrobiales bacterium]|nr:TIM-barrel domain-containing protein [Acidimicrobiales bacterium]